MGKIGILAYESAFKYDVWCMMYDVKMDKNRRFFGLAFWFCMLVVMIECTTVEFACFSAIIGIYWEFEFYKCYVHFVEQIGIFSVEFEKKHKIITLSNFLFFILKSQKRSPCLYSFCRKKGIYIYYILYIHRLEKSPKHVLKKKK